MKTQDLEMLTGLNDVTILIEEVGTSFVCLGVRYAKHLCLLFVNNHPMVIQLGQRERPIKIVGPISQPRRNHWSCVTHADIYSHTDVCFLYQLLL